MENQQLRVTRRLSFLTSTTRFRALVGSESSVRMRWKAKEPPSYLSGIVGARRSFAEIDFSLANLRGADFTGSHFRLAKFRRADLRYASFHGVNTQWSNFNRALFQNADLELAQFDSCNFESVSFSAADLKSTTFSKCNISGAQFGSASSLTDETVRESWAWTDTPPTLPKGIKFEGLIEPGPNGKFRAAYEQMLPRRRGFGPPD
jgi:uncharacterized protein YjbI with pentapeptide repeats